jgi:pimeloyl-ACP methyl ester carboxylesterase
MRLRYTQRGSGEEVVLLLHDVAESGGVWDDVACRLADLDYRVFAIDLRGVLSKYSMHYFAAKRLVSSSFALPLEAFVVL